MRRTQYTYLVTSVTEGRLSLFQRPEYAYILRDAIIHYRSYYALHAFVVMPDHFHALLTPAMDCSVERCAQVIKGASGHRIGLRIWQRGFNDQRVRDESGYWNYVRYIHENPARRGLKDWPHVSSAMDFVFDPMPGGLRGRSPLL